MLWMGTLLLTLNFHAFHVSVTDIKFKEDQKALQISSRIFLDDLELALRDYSGDNKLDIVNEVSWEETNGILKEYLLDNFKASTSKGSLEIQYIGAERDEEVMWCYLEVVKVKKLKDIAIWNNILIGSFQDQENIIHFKAYGKVKSERCF